MKRKIKVEEFNPRAKYRATPASTIRLKGQWLKRVGFHSGQTVELTSISDGVLEIRLCGVPATSDQFTIAAMRLDHAIAAAGGQRSTLISRRA